MSNLSSMRAEQRQKFKRSELERAKGRVRGKYAAPPKHGIVRVGASQMLIESCLVAHPDAYQLYKHKAFAVDYCKMCGARIEIDTDGQGNLIEDWTCEHRGQDV